MIGDVEETPAIALALLKEILHNWQKTVPTSRSLPDDNHRWQIAVNGMVTGQRFSIIRLALEPTIRPALRPTGHGMQLRT